MDIPAIVLQIIFAVVGIVLLVALVYLIRTLKTVCSTIIDTKKQYFQIRNNSYYSTLIN